MANVTPSALGAAPAAARPRSAPDKYIIWVVLTLAALGVVAVYSAITFLAQTKAEGNVDSYLVRHVGRVGLALGAMILFSRLDYHVLARWSKLLIVGAAGLLLVVDLTGVAMGGAVRWLRFGGFLFQPSDFAKVALLLYLAQLLVRKEAYITDFKRAFVPVVFWILLVVLLIGVENLSTATLVLGASVAMCFVGRVPVKYLLGLAVVGLMLATLFLTFSPGRAARIESYLGAKLFDGTDRTEVFDAQSEGYQSQQARIAVARGGLTGVGPGKSIQRDFLPAPYNDFIFAIIAEELGLWGALAVLGLFVVLLFRGFLRIARHAPDPLGLLLAVGLTTLVVLYAFIHAGVASGLLPVTGLPLPFVSYGGTSLLATGAMIGILLNISRQVPQQG